MRASHLGILGVPLATLRNLPSATGPTGMPDTESRNVAWCDLSHNLIPICKPTPTPIPRLPYSIYSYCNIYPYPYMSLSLPLPLPLHLPLPLPIPLPLPLPLTLYP